MESIFSIITALMMAITGASGDTAGAPSSSELGLAELSPAGEAGGLALPASGCSYSHWDSGSGSYYQHDCDLDPPDIQIGDPIIRQGDTTDIAWDPKSNNNCVLLGDLANQGPITTNGSETVAPVADTIYMIMCDNDGDGDPETVQEITVRVLPRIQET